MIVLRNMAKSFKTAAGTTVLFDGVELELPVERRVAVLGPRGSGKTTLIRMLAGMERPSGGGIERQARVSLPVGYGRGFLNTISARQNADFFARCFGADADEVVGFVERVTEMGGHFDKPFVDIPAGLRLDFAYALSYAIPFDVYLIDERPVSGSPRFRKICQAMFEERARTAGFLFATSNLIAARRYCEQALVIRDHKLELHTDIVAALKLMSEAANPRAPNHTEVGRRVGPRRAVDSRVAGDRASSRADIVSEFRHGARQR
jgi:capsular polysaccharide transport system ATP-binding protein